MRSGGPLWGSQIDNLLKICEVFPHGFHKWMNELVFFKSIFLYILSLLHSMYIKKIQHISRCKKNLLVANWISLLFCWFKNLWNYEPFVIEKWNLCNKYNCFNWGFGGYDMLKQLRWQVFGSYYSIYNILKIRFNFRIQEYLSSL